MISGFRMIQGHRIPTELHIEKRRTLAMRFLNHRLIIKAPKDIDPIKIEEWLGRKESWILKHHLILEQSILEEGKAWILNTARLIEFKHAPTLDYHLEEDRLRILKPERMSSSLALERIKLILAQTIIVPILQDAMTLTKLHPTEVRFKNLKGSWGRCSSKGVITLSLKLLECDPGFIQYVCIHELVHLRHMNHSKVFWQEIAYYIPDYKKRKTLTPYTLKASL